MGGCNEKTNPFFNNDAILLSFNSCIILPHFMLMGCGLCSAETECARCTGEILIKGNDDDGSE